MTIVTRFAPSPTGFLHIGGARTALFNWLFARANGGKFLLRIEDTDKARSTEAATKAIFDGLNWLGIEADEEPVFQSKGENRHQEIAWALLERGAAYRCFSTKEEIEAFREAHPHTPFRSPWRDLDTKDHTGDFVIRIKAPLEGETIIDDQVQGQVKIPNATLDDMILLRSDGTPTYMLAVVVDDHDMGVTHIIRGDDHLINAARQSLIFQAMGWDIPMFAHIPLIHGSDGKKLSKRHGALGVEAYREMGYPSMAIKNYLARLGWSHGDWENFTMEEIIPHFGFSGMNKAPARLDFAKLDAVSAYHIRTMSDDDLIDSLKSYVAAQNSIHLDTEFMEKIRPLLPALREKAKKLSDIIENTQFLLINLPINYTDKAQKSLNNEAADLLERLTSQLQTATWSSDVLEDLVKNFCENAQIGLGKIAMPIRASLSGGTPSPSIYDMMIALGKDETLNRLEAAISFSKIE